MKKYLLFFSMMVALIITACHKDDDDNAGSGSFVGTWITSTDTTYKVTFESDGTFYSWYYDSRRVKETSSGKYEYHSDSNGNFVGYLAFETTNSRGETQVFNGQWIIYVDSETYIATQSTNSKEVTKYIKYEPKN